MPEDVQKFLFSMAMVYAVNYIQYSDYVKGYSSNYDMILRKIPDPSIKASEAMIASCMVAVISAVISSGLRIGAKKVKENFTANPARVAPEDQYTVANRDGLDDDTVGDIELANNEIIKDEEEHFDGHRQNQIDVVDSKDDDDILDIEIPNVSPRIQPSTQNSSATQSIFKFH